MMNDELITREVFTNMVMATITFPKRIMHSDTRCFEIEVTLNGNAGPCNLFFVYDPSDIEHSLYRAVAAIMYACEQDLHGGYIPLHEQDGKAFCKANGRDGYDAFVLGDTIKFAYNYDYSCEGKVIGANGGFVLVQVTDGQGVYETGEVLDISLEF